MRITFQNIKLMDPILLAGNPRTNRWPGSIGWNDSGAYCMLQPRNRKEKRDDSTKTRKKDKDFIHLP
jgi:hypothetical protein